MNSRRLDADVQRIAGGKDLYSIELSVESTEPEKRPLNGEVRFFLHDTFANDRPVVTVGPDGRAELRLKAWGAFTVGALADGGDTKLELDLSDLPNAPDDFRSR